MVLNFFILNYNQKYYYASLPNKLYEVFVCACAARSIGAESRGRGAAAPLEFFRPLDHSPDTWI